MALAASCIWDGTGAGACCCWIEPREKGGGLAGVWGNVPGPCRWGVAGGMFKAMVGGGGAPRAVGVVEVWAEEGLRAAGRQH